MAGCPDEFKALPSPLRQSTFQILGIPASEESIHCNIAALFKLSGSNILPIHPNFSANAGDDSDNDNPGGGAGAGGAGLTTDKISFYEDQLDGLG